MISPFPPNLDRRLNRATAWASSWPAQRTSAAARSGITPGCASAPAPRRAPGGYGTDQQQENPVVLDWLRQQIGGHFDWSVADGIAQVDWITSFSDSGYLADGSGD